MSDCDDPTGTFRQGQIIRWKHCSGTTKATTMRVLGVCAPCGLYWRPLLDTDSDFEKQMAHKYSRNSEPSVPCEAGDPGAVYHPENLMIQFQYMSDGGVTTGHATDLAVVHQSLETP